MPRRAVPALVAAALLVVGGAVPAAASAWTPTPGAAPVVRVVQSPTLSTRYVATANGRRPVLMSVPRHWPRTDGAAIVLLHGADSSPEAMERVSSLDEVAAASGIAVASLRSWPVAGRIAGWNAGSCCYAGVASRADDVGYVAATVALLRAQYGVASRDITLVGYSNGGMLAYRFVCEHPNQVGALISVSGARLVPCPVRRVTLPLAVLELHGDRDTTVPYLGTTWQPDLRTRLPSARTSVMGAGARAGCTSYSGYLTVAAGREVLGRGCRATVRLLLVHGLGHGWTRTARVDESAVVVRFAATRS